MILQPTPAAKYLPTLYNLILVCHSWAEAVHNSPAFWARAQTGCSIQAIERALARSRDAPLQVYIETNLRYKNYDEYGGETDEGRECRTTLFHTLDTISSYSALFQSLHFRDSARGSRMLKVLTSAPAPSLEDLAIRLTDPPNRDRPDLQLFKGEANKLRAVGFDNVYVRWDSPIYRNLQSFELSNLPGRHCLSSQACSSQCRRYDSYP